MLRLLSALVLCAGLFIANPPRPAEALSPKVETDHFGLPLPSSVKSSNVPYPAVKPNEHIVSYNWRRSVLDNEPHLQGSIGRDPDYAELTDLGVIRAGAETVKGPQAEWPDIPLHFMATAPKGPHWPVFQLYQKWSTQRLWEVNPQPWASPVRFAVETCQTADFGSLFCLTYAVPDQPAIIREYAFVPVPGRADKDWHYFLGLGAKPARQDPTHAWYKPGDQELLLQTAGWLAIPGRKTPAGTAPEIAGESRQPTTADGVVWRCVVAYRLVEGGEQPADLDLSTSGLHQYRMDDRR